MRIERVALWIVLSCGVSGLVSAQVPSDPKAAEFGPANLTHVRVSAMQFIPQNSNLSGLWLPGPGLTRHPSLYLSDWEGPFQLPGGARLKRVELDYCDTNSSDLHVSLSVLECDNSGQNCAPISATLVSSSNGCAYVADDTLNHRVDAYHHLYSLQASFGTGDGTIALASVILSYALDVSPAPATATFADVPTSSPQFQFVEALVSAGITAGCGPSSYCPNQPITRGQMAVFLAKALGLTWKDY